MAKSGRGRPGAGGSKPGAGGGRPGAGGGKPGAGRGKSRAQRKLEQIRREQRARAIRMRLLMGVGAVVVVAAVAISIAIVAGGGGNGAGRRHPGREPATAPLGPEGIALETGPALAPTSTAATGQTVDGIGCDATEQVVFHIHAHLAVYVGGSARQIPAGIGTVEPSVSQTSRGPLASATRCYYWLHTHSTDGVIHIESPAQRTYTLGDFFDIWRQPLNGQQAGPAAGPVTAFVNGAKYGGDPRALR